MEQKKITACVAGLGSRGNAYAECCAKLPDKIEIVAAADTDPDKLARFAGEYGIPPERCYASAEDMLAAGKLADVMFICTMDRQHYAQAIPALKLGYHLLLEKPASPVPAECAEIARVAREMDRQVIVCHVLRYTDFYRAVKKVIDSGRLGRIMSMQANEQVAYWHQAHSFVRGNWRNSHQTSPMILQKCCHDMDILLWLTGKHCVSVSSFGHLTHFVPESAPQGAGKQCGADCPEYDTCPYSVKKCYIKRAERGNFAWPVDIVEPVPSLERLLETLKTSPYGRCVYHCDNDVVDHQVVNLQLEDDLTVSFSMSAFTAEQKRHIHVMGTHGDIAADMDSNKLTVTVFGHESEVIDTQTKGDQFGHGGGDMGIIRDLVALLDPNDTEKREALTPIDGSIESHIVALAAEKSRLDGGKVISIADYTASL